MRHTIIPMNYNFQSHKTAIDRQIPWAWIMFKLTHHCNHPLREVSPIYWLGTWLLSDLWMKAKPKSNIWRSQNTQPVSIHKLKRATPPQHHIRPRFKPHKHYKRQNKNCSQRLQTACGLRRENMQAGSNESNGSWSTPLFCYHRGSSKSSTSMWKTWVAVWANLPMVLHLLLWWWSVNFNHHNHQ